MKCSFRLNEINKIKDYFIADIWEREYIVNIDLRLIILIRFYWLYLQQVVAFLLLHLVIFLLHRFSLVIFVSDRIATNIFKTNEKSY